MIVATAGHIDHGKTALVRALTGVDTDRLPEEKARGISIDLGFAYLQGEAGLIGFVDVPGHERFVRNMLAGVAGIDLALLVVAADDGVMPQTREHLQILHLLDVRRGIVVISKTDRVSSARVAEVADEVQALLSGTSLAAAPVHRVSAIKGEGVDGLRQTLAAAAAAHRSRYRDGHHFRLAVDRVFSVAGTGTVVTGTVFHGRVKRGDRLVVSPAGHAVRVRGIEIRGLAAEDAQAGDRCALSLAGAEAAQVKRGDWVVEEPLHAPTQRIDVLLKLLPSERSPLEHWTPVHLHLGTDALTARVATPRAHPIQPGASAHAQLVFDRPILAVNSDRYIVRDQSGRRTLGGGIVLDPFAPRRKPGAHRPAQLAALERSDALVALQT
jgi:selenocysteine-specific elongation factor